MSTLLSVPFLPEQGLLMPDYIQVAFAKEGEPCNFILRKKSGEEVGKVPMRILQYARTPTFAMLRPQGPAQFKLPGDGDYEMVVELKGEEIGKVGFSAKVENSGDVFKPKTIWRLTGSWTKLGMLTNQPESQTEPVRLWFWASYNELGGKSPDVTTEVVSGGKVIATGNGFLSANREAVTRYFTDLRVDKNHMFFMRDLQKISGPVTIRLSANGKMFRKFVVDVKGGQVVRPAESELSYSPKTSILLPRLIDPLDRGFKMIDSYWLKAQ